MKLPTVQVADLLAKANFDWIDPDNIYTDNVTPDQNDFGQTTFIRVQDATAALTYHRNNRASALDAEVEVQIFFSTEGKFNVFDIKAAVLRYLQDHGWLISALRPDTIDEDTDQKTVTFYVSKVLRME